MKTVISYKILSSDISPISSGIEPFIKQFLSILHHQKTKIKQVVVELFAAFNYIS